MHPYPKEYLTSIMGTLGKAFEFADRTLSGGVERFYPLFAKSDIAASLSEDTDKPDIGLSGIAVVLEICGTARNEVIDELVQGSISSSKADFSYARWLGQSLAHYQWESGVPFRTIAAFLSSEELRRIYAEVSEGDWADILSTIEHVRRRATSSTQLRKLRCAFGLTQAELSKRSHVSLRSIQQYEQRKKDINRAQAHSIYALSQVLNCQMEELLEVDDIDPAEVFHAHLVPQQLS